MEEYLQLVGDEDDGLVAKLLPDGVTEHVIGHMGIKGTERVVQDINVPLAVQSTGQADSLTLTTTQVSAALANLIKHKHEHIMMSSADRLTVTAAGIIGSDVTSVRSALGSRARSDLRQQALRTD